jgi:predicted ATPase
MGRLPSGTVTFLFTDIEGSTRLLHELGDRYLDARSEHHRALRAAAARHGGVEVDTQGDAFFFAFASASNALGAAAEIRRTLADGPIAVRIGLHTGEPIVTEDGYVGIDVHKGARIAAAGHGGQVLVSETTAGLIERTDLRDLGAHRLKDLGPPMRLYQLGAEEFPALRTLFGTNLPIQATPLVGREGELAEAGELLRERRLVTFVGPAGSGKTRLALQLAAEGADAYPDGVFWVPLQAVSDPSLVEPTIARALGAQASAAERIGDRRVLLLLDGFEHLLDAASAVAGLVRRTPHAKLLVTSREPLRVAGEHRYRVEPLPEEDAAALFVERARAVDPGFVVGPAVAEICSRLDGLPLALELAAARVSVLDASDLLARLEHRLSVLTGGSRDSPAHHRTLRTAIEWSHELLEPEERRALARLAVFAGSFDAAAAEAVCSADLDLLQSLVEKSLLRRWGSGRFGMLETIHEFAHERLREAAEAEDVRRRHAVFFVELAERAEPELEGDDQLAWFDRVDDEHPNLRAALDWALGLDDNELALRLAGALGHFWWIHGHWSEGRRWLERALDTAPGLFPALRTKALIGAAQLAYRQADFETSRRLAKESLAISRRRQDPRDVGRALRTLAYTIDDPGAARRLLEESATLSRAANDPWNLAITLNNRGVGALGEGDLDRARTFFEDALAAARQAGDRRSVSSFLYNLGLTAFLSGEGEEARTRLRQSITLARTVGYTEAVVDSIACLAATDATEGEYERAASLLGAADALMSRMLETSSYDVEQDVRERTLATLRERWDLLGLERAWNEGAGWSLDEAAEHALADA